MYFRPFPTLSYLLPIPNLHYSATFVMIKNALVNKIANLWIKKPYEMTVFFSPKTEYSDIQATIHSQLNIGKKNKSKTKEITIALGLATSRLG